MEIDHARWLRLRVEAQRRVAELGLADGALPRREEADE